MRRHLLCALVLTAIGCSGSVEQTPSEQEQKLAAATARASGTAQGDPCAQHRWYGDGVCDTFCSDTDSDCVPKGDAVVCAQFSEAPNGKCDRAASDACRFQDPDCTTPPTSTPGTGGAPGSTPPSGVACALVSEVPNGSCDRAESDPCRFQDPDCNTGGTTPSDPDCDASKIVCQTFAPVVCPAGQVPSVVNGCYGPCVAKETCSGSSSGGATGSGGAPSASGGNTGSGAGPSTSGGATGSGGAPSASGGSTAGGSTALLDCDPRNITCLSLVAVTCPDGQVPSVVNHCYGACVTKDKCAPIVCTAISEVPDGVCSRPANDPCRTQDPDCVSDPVVCAQYIEASDGKCDRPADDPCRFQDPDCSKK